MWTRSFIISTALNLGDLDYVTNRLLRNPADFADVLRPLYGNEIALRFENLFTDHLLIAANLVNAAKAGDTKMVDEERKKWYANADDISRFLSEINPYWSKRNWQTMLYEHLQMTEKEAVQILTEQYEESIAEYDSIEKQALKMGDDMAYGIIKQFQI
ncbi:MAG: acetylglutamate kinase [Anaerotignum sp.]|nr:acetylglutamate kinase [Anaerotignum sp.]